MSVNKTVDRVMFVIMAIIYPPFIVVTFRLGAVGNGFLVLSAAWFCGPCCDPLFGNRRKLFWVRQTLIVIGALATIAASLITAGGSR